MRVCRFILYSRICIGRFCFRRGRLYKEVVEYRDHKQSEYHGYDKAKSQYAAQRTPHRRFSYNHRDYAYCGCG